MQVEIGVLLAVIGCLVGLAGWLTGRDKKITGDAEWRGQVNGKLDVIVGIRNDVDNLDHKVEAHGERIAKVEASASSAHKRLDEIVKGVTHEQN